MVVSVNLCNIWLVRISLQLKQIKLAKRISFDLDPFFFSSLLKGKETWEMDADEKLQQAEIAKEKGTKYFKVVGFLITKVDLPIYFLILTFKACNLF